MCISRAAGVRLGRLQRCAVLVAHRAQVALQIHVPVPAHDERSAFAAPHVVTHQRPVVVGRRGLAVSRVSCPALVGHEAIHCVSLDLAVRATDATTASMTSTVNGIETANTSW